MTVVVDSNILFSACISPNNKIAEILFSPLPHIHRVGCYYSISELFKHHDKISNLSKLSSDKLNTLLYAILKQVEFINENMINEDCWKAADELTREIDSNDIVFVAMALSQNALLWTGDKKLTDHLKKKCFSKVINTSELYEMLKIS